MTSYPISLPTGGVNKSKIVMDAAAAVSESPFTFEQQVYVHPGQRWKLMIQLAAMRRATAESWITAMAKLNGRQGTFLYGDPDAKVPRGIATGVPEINGAGQVGNSISTKGWTPNTPGILLAGDYFQLGSGATARLYKALSNADADGSGYATLSIWPNLRGASVNSDPVTLVNAMTQFRLDAPFGWDADQVSTYNGITITASEAL